MKKTLTSLLTLFLAWLTGSCQQSFPLINSGELIRKGVLLNDSGQYKKAIDLYTQVGRNDTNYVQALYEKAVSLSADSQYEESIHVCQQALSLTTQRNLEPDIYNQYGNALDATGQFEKALAVYDSGIHKYPAYSLLLFNKGIIFMEQGRMEDAEAVFRETLMLNPYQYSAHFNLGIAAMQQGKVIPAFLSFIGYLLMTPEGRYSARTIRILNEISHSTDEILKYKNNRRTDPGENYRLQEEIVFSKIALDKQYKPLLKLDDPISRQIQLLFEKLEYAETDTSFWMQYYVPYFRQVFTNGRFELFINHIFSGVNIASIQEYNKKNKKEKTALIRDAAIYFNLIHETRELVFTKRESAGIRYLYEDGELQGRGYYNSSRKVLSGPWEFYYPAGNRKATGRFNDNGKREGDWTYYYYDGKIKAKEHYINDSLEGKQITYFDNGLVSSEKYYTHDAADGSSADYYRIGLPASISIYKMGKLQGEKKEYYPVGGLKAVTAYSNDLQNGPYRYYYENGRLSTTATYRDGLLDGRFNAYSENGGLATEGSYTKDKAEGEWKTYHNNKQLKEKEFFVNGKLEGPYEQYHDNGTLFTRYINKKGKTTGEAPYYDRDGKLFSTLFFDKDIIGSGKYFDKSGRQIQSSERKNKSLYLVVFSPDGYKTREIPYDEKGNISGIRSDYYASGGISEKATYQDGELNGDYTSYFPNGNKKITVAMSGGMKNGFYREYFSHGQLQSEGWYANDQMQGEWRFYNQQGNLIMKTYYLNGDLYGYREEYWPNGKKYLEQRYRGGWMEEMTQYDTMGNILRHDLFPQGNGKYILVYPNGKKSAEGEYLHGELSGQYTTYYFDGSVQSTGYYKEGKRDSLYRSFYFGGKKYLTGQFFYGKKTGTWKKYDEDDNLYSAETYVADNLSGKQVYYYKDGKPDREIFYKDGQRNGLTIKRETDSTLMYQILYEDNAPKTYTYLGPQSQLVQPVPVMPGGDTIKTYYTNGQLSRKVSFADGLVNGKDILYYKTGKQYSSGTESYGIVEGPWQEFYPSGQLKSGAGYQHDNLHGGYKEYYPSGTLKEEGNFYNGNYHGKYMKYDESGRLKETRIYYYGDLLEIINK
jgi:antitoxin component YwqK of YwqJK toxin-antitoxin module/Tfp pilus assembly protein PilF